MTYQSDNWAILTVVAGALIDAEGRVLIQQRRTGKSHAGLWEFPGGKVEPFETPENALVRELREELGISVNPLHLTPFSFSRIDTSNSELLLLLYLCRLWEGAPNLLDAADMLWVNGPDLLSTNLTPADIPLARQLVIELGSPKEEGSHLH